MRVNSTVFATWNCLNPLRWYSFPARTPRTARLRPIVNRRLSVNACTLRGNQHAIGELLQKTLPIAKIGGQEM
eukprot:629502-Lingulodinium_polyedra.AAC.1